MAKEKNKTEQPVVLEGELQARLIQLREDAGYSTSQLADTMCLSEDVIISLENENFGQLAEPPYVRGYLRNYAKLGETDANELISRYEALRGADTTELDYQIKTSTDFDISKRKSISPVWSQVILLAILVSGIALLAMIPGVNQWFKSSWHDISNQLQAPNGESSNNPLLTGSLPVPAPLPDTDVSIGNSTTNLPSAIGNTSNNKPVTTKDSGQTKQSEQTIDNIDTNSANKQSIASIDKTSTTPTENKQQKESSATNSGNQIKIKLVFNKDVWLRIRNKENKTVFEGLNKLGTNKDLTIEKPSTFRVGNAQGLSLFVNDKAVDISQYINGSIANFTLE